MSRRPPPGPRSRVTRRRLRRARHAVLGGCYNPNSGCSELRPAVASAALDLHELRILGRLTPVTCTLIAFAAGLQSFAVWAAMALVRAGAGRVCVGPVCAGSMSLLSRRLQPRRGRS